MDNFINTLRALGPGRLVAIGGVGLAVVVFFAFATARISAPNMALLYSDLATEDAGAIVSELDNMGVNYTADANGNKIRVAEDQVGKLRMQLAEMGLPSGGSIGYEIFDQESGFSTTQFKQHINQLRAMEGELIRTVSTLSPVKTARVHLVLPKRELFTRDTPEASASVFVQTKTGRSLNNEQISSIQHMVATAVQNLDPTRVSIVDQNGNLLAKGEGADSSQFRSDTIAQYKQQYEQRMTRAIEELVGSTVGYGKVRATVNADVNFDRIQTNSEEYDPETQVARSTQLIEESEESSESDQPNVGVANNLPGLPAEEGGGGQDTAQSNRIEEVTNFEISKTVTNSVREGGRVDKLSVAVLVDGNYVPGEEGEEQQYEPRTEEELNQIESLVRSAIGYDETRGDQLEVVNMQFAERDNMLEDAGPIDDSFFMGLTKTDLFKIGEMGMIGIVAILVILLVVRPMVQNLSEIGQIAGRGDDQPRLEGQPQKAIASQAANTMMQPEEEGQDERDQEMIDLEQIEGRVKASSVRKVSDIIDSHPGETVSVIRGWLFDEG